MKPQQTIKSSKDIEMHETLFNAHLLHDGWVLSSIKKRDRTESYESKNSAAASVIEMTSDQIIVLDDASALSEMPGTHQAA